MLGGLRVLDLGPGIAPSFCARMLADYGADVIKVEPPMEGDPARRMGPFVGDDPHLEKSIPFLYLNTGKRGVTLDYSGDTGLAILHQLLDEADVLVEGFTPTLTLPHQGGGDRAAISYKELSRSPPKAGGHFRHALRAGRAVPGLPGHRHHHLRHERADVPFGRLGQEPLRNALDQSLYVAGANAAAATLVAVFARLTSDEGSMWMYPSRSAWPPTWCSLSPTTTTWGPPRDAARYAVPASRS